MSRYAEAHKNLQGPGDSRPTALQIVEDEGLVGNLTDKVFVVTGVSSGLGIETMRALYATGGHVFGTVRDIAKGEKVVADIKSTTPSSTGKITLVQMALDDLSSVKRGAESILSQTSTLNIVVNNAGVMATPAGKTVDGFETQFGTNHLGHFYLFQLLKPLLLSSATPGFPSRVVSVSSFGHRCGPVRFDDYHFSAPDSYDPCVAYGQAKTANIYFSNELERRYGAKNLHSTSLHPGGIMTGLQVHVPQEAREGWDDASTNKYMKNAEQGAATSVYAALSQEWKDKGGKYLSDCVEQAPVRTKGNPMVIFDDGYEQWAYDAEKEGRLWKESLDMVGLKDDQ